MTTPVMPDELLQQYVFDRKLFSEPQKRAPQLGKLRRIIIHNGFSRQEVQEARRFGSDVEEYQPLKSMETHFFNWKTGDLDVFNTKGMTRFARDHAQARFLARTNHAEVDVHHYGGDAAAASARFERFAFQKNKDIFATLRPYANTILKQGELHVISGPHQELEMTVREQQNDYLNHRILDLEGKIAIHVDYLFGDQAKILLGNFYRFADADFPKLPINIYQYGKMGILSDSLSIGDIIVPVAALDERALRQGNNIPVPLYNEIAKDEAVYHACTERLRKTLHKGITIHTDSVMEQTIEQLQADKEAGGDFLDMELLPMRGISFGTQQQVRFFALGIASDKPLAGQTLADTPYAKEEERRVLAAYTHLIAHRSAAR